jgi:hypothetical protein
VRPLYLNPIKPDKMANFEISIPGLFSVGAPDAKALELLIARALELRAEYGSTLPLAGSSVAPSGSRTPNVDKWEAKHGKRLRMTGEERADFGEGEDARESAAKERLVKEGDTLAEGGGLSRIARESAAGAMTGEAIELDENELV